LDWLSEYWHQILFFGVIIVNAVRAREQLSEAQKDLSTLHKQMERVLRWTQDQQEALVKLRADTDVEQDQRKMLWEFTNKLRDMLGDIVSQR